MKKIIATILTLGSLNFCFAQEQSKAATSTQPAKPNPPTPEQIATRQSMHLQKMLTLTDDQKQKTYQAVLTRTSAMQAVHTKFGPDGDKKSIHKEIIPLKEQFVQTMNTILSPEQKTKWEDHRLKFKERRAKNKTDKEVKPADAEGNGAPKKLMSDDDGIDD